jgi:hypothetical protein
MLENELAHSKENLVTALPRNTEVPSLGTTTLQNVSFCFFLFPFGSPGVWTQDLPLQATHLIPHLQPFSPSGYFSDRISHFLLGTVDCDPPMYASHRAGITEVHHTQFYLLRWGLAKFFFFYPGWPGTEILPMSAYVYFVMSSECKICSKNSWF